MCYFSVPNNVFIRLTLVFNLKKIKLKEGKKRRGSLPRTYYVRFVRQLDVESMHTMPYPHIIY